jgi:hypothetical protein
MDVDAVLNHLQQHLVPYILLALGLVVIIFATRRYSLPIIQYTIEVLIYAAALHLLVWGVASGAAAFKRASSFQPLESQRQLEATWTTPILHFWKLDEYEPAWLWKVELVGVAIVLYLVWKLRPIRIQKSTRATIPAGRRMAGQGARVPGAFGRVGGRRK